MYTVYVGKSKKAFDIFLNGRMQIKPLEKIDLRAQVGDQLKDLIISGALKPGESLMEVQLAGALGVSRTPVREALQVLHSEGFIEEKKAKGYRIPLVSVEEAKEIYQLVGLIEANLIRGFGEFDKEALITLRKINQALTKKGRGGKEQIFLDRNFHETLIEGSKNETAKKILGDLRQKSLRYEFLNYQNKDRLQNSGDEHLEIIKHLEKGDIKGAAEKVEAHWRLSANRLVAALG